MREKSLSALHSSMGILISGPEVFFPFQFKENLTVPTVLNTGETGDIY